MFTADAVARIDRSLFFRELYGEAPEFTEVELAEFTISGMRPGVSIRFLPSNSPCSLPKKWLLSSFNAASIELDFIQIKSISVTKFGPMAVCSLHLSWQDGRFELLITGDLEARMLAEHCFVQKISGYQRGERRV